MAQPKWRLVAQLGDADPIENGGYFVFVDETGVFPPEAELWNTTENEDGLPNGWTLYRWTLDKCTHVNRVLSDNQFHPEVAAWFADSLTAIAELVDYPDGVPGLIADLCSDDPIKLATAYEAVKALHGADNFDAYPLELSREEIVKRYSQHTNGSDP